MDLFSDETLQINKIDINKTAYTVIVIILEELPAITLSLEVNLRNWLNGKVTQLWCTVRVQ